MNGGTQALVCIAWLLLLAFFISRRYGYFGGSVQPVADQTDVTVPAERLTPAPAVENLVAAKKPASEVTLPSDIINDTMTTLQVSAPITEKGSALPPVRTAETTQAPVAGPTAAELLTNVKRRYASAKTYSDSALLFLNYKLGSEMIRDQYRWSTHWDTAGHWWAEMFDTQVNCDGKLLSCVVRNIDSDNLDDQQLVIPASGVLPLKELYSDPIASHFLTGMSQLPLSLPIVRSNAWMVPVPLTLLAGQPQSPWLAQSDNAVRRPDETIKDRPCYVVEAPSPIGSTKIWIDKKNDTIVRMGFPTKLIDPKVVASPMVTNLEFYAEFTNLAIDGPQSSRFEPVVARKDGQLVRQFVKVPDRLPTELLGQTTPAFSFLDHHGQPVKHLAFDGKTTALIWLASEDPVELLEKIASVKQSIGGGNDFHVAAVVSDEATEPLAGGGMRLAKPLLDASLKTGVPVYTDPGLVATKSLRLGLQSTSSGLVMLKPMVMVIDPDGKIEYAKAAEGDQWVSELTTATKLIADGTRVSRDMKREYKSFLDQYYNDLTRVSAASLFPDLKPINPIPVEPARPRRVAEESTIQLMPNLMWTAKDLSAPGNVIVDRDGNRVSLLIFDGYQTVRRLALDGRLVESLDLELPDNESASLIRVARTKNGTPTWAVFNRLGKQAHFFDADWQRLGSFPPAGVQNDGINDIQPVSVGASDGQQFLVSFNDDKGSHLIDPNSGESEPLSGQVAQSVAEVGDSLLIIEEGEIGVMGGATKPLGGQAQRIVAVGNGPRGKVAVSVVDAKGQWSIQGVDEKMSSSWEVPVGSLFFTDNELEPLAAVQTAGGETLWAVADAKNLVYLISGDGKWLGDFEADADVQGLALVAEGDDISLIVSMKDSVEGWALNYNARVALPASSRQ